MAVVPETRIGKVVFYETHVGQWAEHAAALGLSAGEVAELAELTAAAREASEAQQAARLAAEAATLRFHTAVARMAARGSGVLKQIKAVAGEAEGAGGAVAVYVLARIPVPAARSPIPPPGRPYGFRAELLQNGAIVLRWKCDNPANSTGTMYEVRRRAYASGGSRAFAFLGTTGVREFIDETVGVGAGGVGGAGGVTYEVVAFRSTRRGEGATFNVSIGVAGAGGAGGAEGVGVAA